MATYPKLDSAGLRGAKAEGLRQLHGDHPDTVGVTDEMIQAACVAGYGVDTDKDSNLYKLMRRALAAGIAARR